MNSNILALVAFLGVASAAPQLKTRAIAVGDKFSLTAIHSGSAVHLSSFQAQNGRIFAGLDAQGATCDSASETATFYIGEDGALNLYSTDAPFQKAFVDASGMGQGVFGYTTGAQPAPTNGQQYNFTVDSSDHLNFLTSENFIACPYNDAFTIWANAGVDNPAGNQNCTSISALATKIDAPISCTYTSD